MARANEVEFYPATFEERQGVHDRGLKPEYFKYACAGCGSITQARIVASARRRDATTNLWCLCNCGEPTCLVRSDRGVLSQSPSPLVFAAGKDWPEDLAKLYDEAAVTYSAGAYTAASMVCRKVLMACACEEGEADGKSFLEYVDFISGKVLTFPKAKTAIDKIRGIGNDANHEIAFVSRGDATTSLRIVKYMLDTIYSLPAA